MQLSHYAQLFFQFLSLYNISYESTSVWETRFQIFVDNMIFIDQYNAFHPSVTLGITPFADRTPEEFQNEYWGLSGWSETCGPTTFQNSDPLPDGIDWREKGVVTPIKNQGRCGSCWAFATAETAESVQALSNPSTLVELAPRQLVDCNDENFGCSGGYMDVAMKYVVDHGLVAENDYPYVPAQGNCTPPFNRTVYQPTDCFRVPSRNELSMKKALVQHGPLVVTIEAESSIFQFYNGGVILTEDCGTELNHAVQLIGYGEDDEGYKYWIVRNSWGTLWGEQGYFRLERKDNENTDGTCGVAMGVWGFV